MNITYIHSYIMNKSVKSNNPTDTIQPSSSSSSSSNINQGQSKYVREPNSKADFDTMVEFYLASNPIIADKRGVSELEIRFGTSNKRDKQCRHIIPPISKIDYDNVIRNLYAAGFTTADPEGYHILRIQNEYMETREGETRISNVRAEVMGLDLIQEYCRTNNLQKLIDLPSTVSASADKIKFTQKTPPQIQAINENDHSRSLRPVEFPDFNFRVSYSTEEKMREKE